MMTVLTPRENDPKAAKIPEGVAGLARRMGRCNWIPTWIECNQNPVQEPSTRLALRFWASRTSAWLHWGKGRWNGWTRRQTTGNVRPFRAKCRFSIPPDRLSAGNRQTSAQRTASAILAASLCFKKIRSVKSRLPPSRPSVLISHQICSINAARNNQGRGRPHFDPAMMMDDPADILQELAHPFLWNCTRNMWRSQGLGTRRFPLDFLASALLQLWASLQQKHNPSCIFPPVPDPHSASVRERLIRNDPAILFVSISSGNERVVTFHSAPWPFGRS